MSRNTKNSGDTAQFGQAGFLHQHGEYHQKERRDQADEADGGGGTDITVDVLEVVVGNGVADVDEELQYQKCDADNKDILIVDQHIEDFFDGEGFFFPVLLNIHFLQEEETAQTDDSCGNGKDAVIMVQLLGCEPKDLISWSRAISIFLTLFYLCNLLYLIANYVEQKERGSLIYWYVVP